MAKRCSLIIRRKLARPPDSLVESGTMILDPARAAEIAANLAEMRQRMAAAAERSGRGPADVRLVAVSKTYPLADIAAALAAGQHDFGENRLEELWQKAAAANAEGLDAIRWHMIGTIQSRKTGNAVGPLTLIHAVDRAKIARAPEPRCPGRRLRTGCAAGGQRQRRGEQARLHARRSIGERRGIADAAGHSRARADDDGAL
jgi:hypothetical protein